MKEQAGCYKLFKAIFEKEKNIYFSFRLLMNILMFAPCTTFSVSFFSTVFVSLFESYERTFSHCTVCSLAVGELVIERVGKRKKDRLNEVALGPLCPSEGYSGPLVTDVADILCRPLLSCCMTNICLLFRSSSGLK